MPARSEPLLWVQLIGAGLLPLEALLLLLVLGGADPGPVPALERLLCWGLGALGPSLLLWHRPADVWSLLLLQTPLRARRPLQQRLSRLQEALVPRLGLALGGALSLPLLWWLDAQAAVGAPFSPLAGSPRLVVLLLAAVVLALMLWQWQQLLQALWLLTRRPEVVAAARPLGQADLEELRTCLGLPLLLLDPLRIEAPAAPSADRAAGASSATPDTAARSGRPAAAPDVPSPLGSEAGAGQSIPPPSDRPDRAAAAIPQAPEPLVAAAPVPSRAAVDSDAGSSLCEAEPPADPLGALPLEPPELPDTALPAAAAAAVVAVPLPPGERAHPAEPLCPSPAPEITAAEGMTDSPLTPSPMTASVEVNSVQMEPVLMEPVGATDQVAIEPAAAVATDSAAVAAAAATDSAVASAATGSATTGSAATAPAAASEPLLTPPDPAEPRLAVDADQDQRSAS